MKSLNKKEIKEILIKNWMTHDGMWFLHSVNNCGIEKTNKINKAAVKSMAEIEIKRLKRAFNLNKIKTFKDFQLFLKSVFNIVKADFMDFTFSYPSKNKFQFTMNKCFAYEGINRIGIIDQYECGIFERIETWFDGLGLEYEVKPKIEGCLMHTEGKCFREYKFFFEE